MARYNRKKEALAATAKEILDSGQVKYDFHQQILNLMVEGFSHREISAQIGVGFYRVQSAWTSLKNHYTTGNWPCRPYKPLKTYLKSANDLLAEGIVLNPKHREILCLYASGLNSVEISKKLSIHPGTIRMCRKRYLEGHYSKKAHGCNLPQLQKISVSGYVKRERDQQILTLLAAGASVKQISLDRHMPVSTINSIIRRYKHYYSIEKFPVLVWGVRKPRLRAIQKITPKPPKHQKQFKLRCDNLNTIVLKTATDRSTWFTINYQVLLDLCSFQNFMSGDEYPGILSELYLQSDPAILTESIEQIHTRICKIRPQMKKSDRVCLRGHSRIRGLSLGEPETDESYKYAGITGLSTPDEGITAIENGLPTP